MRLRKRWASFTITVYSAQVSARIIGMCTFAVICNSHITGPLAGESAAEQPFPSLTTLPQHPAERRQHNSVRNEKKKRGFIKLQRPIYRFKLSAGEIRRVRIEQLPCVPARGGTHPERPVSAARPRCRWCEASRSGGPGSARRCWTCTAEPGWCLESQPDTNQSKAGSTSVLRDG